MRIEELVGEARSAVILGHVRPDGDCVGSCLGLYNYLGRVCPELFVQVYLEPFTDSFAFLQGAENISSDFGEEKTYDLCFALDCSDTERLGDAIRYFESAGRTVCIDHHITNAGYAGTNVIKADASSTCEVLTTLMDKERIDLKTAECLYLGIVHDTGVFKHSNTKEATMRTAGALLSKGVPSSWIIDDTFYKKTFVQNKLLGQALLASELLEDGMVIASCLTVEDMQRFGADACDLEGIVDQLRVTDGVEVAVFLHELTPGTYKVSMRANTVADVSRIAMAFGGGGHVKAAGCTVHGEYREQICRIAAMVREQLA